MSSTPRLPTRNAALEKEVGRILLRLAEAETELARRQRFTDVLLETIDVGIVFCDADGGGWVRNRAEREMLGLEATAKEGLSPEAAATRTEVRDLAGQPIPVDDYPLMRALRGEDVGKVELVLGPTGGPHREVVSHSARIVDADGVGLGAVTTLTDVSVERAGLRELASEHQRLLEAQRDTQQAESRFRKVFDQAGVGAVIIGLDGAPTDVNEAACVLMGRPRNQLVGVHWSQYLAPGQMSTGDLVQSHLSAGRDTFDDERRYLRPDGSTVWLTAHLSLVRDELGAPDYVLAQIADITERRRMELDLDHQALHDALTDLPNRFLFAERVRQALVEASGAPVTVLVMSVSGLQAGIDQNGYGAGDVVLQEIARRLVESVQGEVTIGHLQPGQFAVLVGGGTHDAVRAAEEALGTVVAPVQLLSRHVTLSAGVGICAAPEGSEAEDPEAMVGRLIQDATAAARRAGTAGSGGIAFASKEMRNEQEQQHRTELLLRDALDNDRVGVAYQPVVDLATGRIVGAEALLRISDTHGRPIPPQELIPVAEESGLIVEIGIRVMRMAAEQAATWRAEHGVLLPVAVNVSAVQLERPGFREEVLRATELAGVPPGALSIELTESVLLDSGSDAIEKLRELRDAGVQLAIDDFGTGYASLSYLRDLPATSLKIDRSFVDGIPRDRGAVAIVAAVIGLARNFGMTCIAEGIETEAQLAYLAQRGVHGQGYLLGRPAAGSAIGALLARQDKKSHVPLSGDDRHDLAGSRRVAMVDQPEDAGEERDAESFLRDRAGDVRDARADQRDAAAAQRDLAADARDHEGTVRDRAAQLRDARAAQDDSDVGPAPRPGGAPINLSSAARRGAAKDRRQASNDRQAGAIERTEAGTDRDAALTDRDAGAQERVQAELDRNIALADRGAALVERAETSDDRLRPDEPGGSAEDRSSEAVDLHAALDRVDDGFVALDRDGHVRAVNRAAAGMLGRPVETLVGRSFWAEFPSVVGTAFDLRCQEAFETQQMVEFDQRYDPLGRWFSIRVYPSPAGVALVFRDITDLRSLKAEHRAFLVRLLEAEDRERARIAADVHEDSVQALGAVSLQLQLLSRHLPSPSPTVESLLETLRGAVLTATDRLRALLFSLETTDTTTPISASIRTFAAHVFDGSSTHWSVDDIDIGPELSRLERSQALRIAREALSNARAHAEASEVIVTLRGDEHGLEIVISDDGVAVDPLSFVSAPGHRGLATMQDRAAIVGGTCSLEPSLPHGCTVRVFVPRHQPW